MQVSIKIESGENDIWIERASDGTLWLTLSSGEGMQVNESDLFDLLVEFYDTNF